MGLPSKRRTSTSKNNRRSHHALKGINTVKCSACGAPALPHKACPTCGEYKGAKVVNVEKRTERRAKKLKAIS
ncbi:MAG: 50S ribosomal protein L32 [Candidatus Magasanikbacteria bacterium]|nr:50S ribosomal protein L32 [Candidatus Magasanikbacteria bacterium]MBT4071971.1 50S ribosomal protein L32 [Candidatus Magasanikbacteria bacterium]